MTQEIVRYYIGVVWYRTIDGQPRYSKGAEYSTLEKALSAARMVYREQTKKINLPKDEFVAIEQKEIIHVPEYQD